MVVLAATVGPAARASAQEARGFALERFAPSAAGAGWFVMDDLDMQGGLGAAVAATTSYARNPLRLEDGRQQLAVVSSQAFITFGLSVSYDRWRASLDLPMPLLIEGNSGTIGGSEHTGPSVTLGSHPDTLSDPRLGIEARLLGAPRGPVRVGLSAQLIAPNGQRRDDDSDGTFRGILRALVAGDAGAYRYAGQLGVHLRPLDEPTTGGSPQGSELLFGAAAGAQVATARAHALVLIVGPEIFGASALRSLFGSTTTGVEALFTGRLEGTAPRGQQVRLKLGAGAGLHQDFGAPEWRVVFSIETSSRGQPRR